jgi:hypothetical protein
MTSGSLLNVQNNIFSLFEFTKGEFPNYKIVVANTIAFYTLKIAWEMCI